MRKLSLMLLFICSISSVNSQIIFRETFDGKDGPTAGGAGTYVFPAGWFLRNVDNRTPAGSVAYVNEAWERREDFNFNVTDSCAFSTSWYSPVGPADDWMWTPLIGPLPANAVLKWNAVAYDPAFQDGYEVRIMTSAGGPPTGGSGVLGNQVTNSTVIFSTAAENSSWTAHEVDLSAYAGQSVYIAFRNNSNDKFLLLIDDVSVEVEVEHDAQLLSFTRPTDYSKIPLQQVTPFPFAARIRNNGTQSITNVSLTAKVYNSGNTEIFSSTSAPATLASGAFADFTTPLSFTPGQPDFYRVELTANLAEVDDNTGNNMQSDHINITDTVYARDTSTMVGSLGIGAGNGYLGQHFVVTTTDLLTSVSMFINQMNDPTNVGMAVFAFENGKPTTLLYNAPPIAIPALTPGAWYSFPVLPNDGLTTLPDTIVITAVEIDNTIAIGQTNDRFTNGTTWINWTANPFGDWANAEAFGPQFAKTFMIRANFGQFCTSLADVNDPTDQVLCNGAATTAVTFTGSLPGTIFNWVNNTPSIGLAANGSGDIASFNAINTGTAPVIATITVYPFDGTCNGPLQTFTITVNPSPTANAAPATQNITCSGTAITTIVLSSATSGTTYSWTRDNVATVTGIAANGTGDISGSLTNTTAAPVTVTFTITPLANGCPGTPTTATVTVDPSIIADPVTNQVLCNGANTTAVTFTSPTPGTTFSWVNNTPSIGLAANGSTDNIPSFTAINTTNAPVTATITVTPAAAVSGGSIIPELLYYDFNGAGTSVPNLASAPPSGTASATLMGGLTQGGSAICSGTLIGTGASSTNDYVNTGWTTNLDGTSWSISFKTSNIPSSTSTQYVFGDINAGSFRCFTGGVAGAGNWILRGAFTDVSLPGGASTTETTNTFVYDMPANEIRAYLNGVLVSTVPQAAVTINGPGPFKVGGYSTNAGLPNGAQLDEFKLFNRALTPAEITELAGCTASTNCTGTPSSFTITVNPTPTVDAVASESICAGSNTTAVTFTGAVAGTVYNWTNDTPSIGLAASGTGDIASFAATNTGTTAVIATITVTPSYTNAGSTCTGTPTTYTITVYPTADVNTVADQVVCNGANTTAIAFSGAIAGTTFNWINTTPSIGLAASGSGDIASFIATNTGTTPVVATITVTPSNAIPSSFTETFNYTGGMQTWTVPAGVTSITIDAYGAGGGTGADGGSVSGNTLGGAGGKGTRTTGTLAVTPGQVLNIFVGGAGAIPTGGFNGGGNGGNQNSGGGGGATDVRYPGTTSSDRIIVAGGGGGGGRGGCESTNTINGGAGGDGDSNGANGTDAPTSGGFAGAGGGGILNNGGAAGVGCGGFLGQPGLAGNGSGIGGNGGGGQACCCFSFGSIPGGGGGGGGFVGGGGGGGGSAGTASCSGNDKGAGGGGAGGSSYTGGVTGGSTTLGVQTGNGLVVITYDLPGTTCTGTPKTFTITVNPTPDAIATPASQTICSANPITTIALTSSVSGTTYNWTRDNTAGVTGIAASGAGNISGTLTNTTSAPVTVTFTITPTANGCPGTPITATVLVNPTPNAVATPASQTICTATPITTIVLDGSAVSGTTYNWTRNNTVNVTGIAASGAGNISGTLTNTTTIQQTVTFTITPVADGCPGTPIIATVIVNPLPTVTCPSNITVSNDAGICGAVVTYPAATATGTPAPTITYSHPSGSTFPVGTTTVTVTATNSCGTATCTFDITVNDTQAPSITCPANITRNTDPGVCTASIAVPDATTADNCAVTTLTWVLTGATTGTSAATGINNIGTRTFNMGVTTATYTIKDAAGNTSTCSFSITVNDGQLPAISAQPANTTVCAGSNAVFSVVASNAVSYQWQQWNGSGWVNVASATASSLTLNAVTQSQNTSTYRVVITGLCSTVNSNAASLYVNPLPTISLTSSNSPVLLPGQTTSIIANVNPTGGTFAWLKNGAPRVPTVTGGTLSNLTVDDAGTYRTTYTDPNGCISTSADLVISAEVSNQFFIGPNPNLGQFWVRYYNQTGESLTVIVFDTKGRRVHQQQSATGLAYTRIDVDMGLQAGGIYVVELRGTDGRLLGRKQIIVGQRF